MAGYWHGCNYPWSTDGTTIFYGLDFGASVWGSHLGVSTRRDAVTSDFLAMAALGFTVVRWFVFCDGRSGIVYDGWGLPSGMDAHVLADLDAALEIAGSAGIRLDLVMLDHHWMFSGLRDTLADPVTGTLLEARLPRGRAGVLTTGTGREALFAHVLVPIVRRYSPGGTRADLAAHILAYEFMNEPDFVVEEWQRDLSSRVRRALPFEVAADLVSGFSAVVHTHSQALTTIGCARLHNLWAWDDSRLGVDVLQLHSYPDVRRTSQDRDVYGVPAAALGVRRPVILGEFPGNAPEQHPRAAAPPGTTLEEYLEFAVAAGYAGAWPWSFSGTDEYGRLPEAPLRQFAARHPELVNPRALAPSTG
jgi:hypothetical protein